MTGLVMPGQVTIMCDKIKYERILNLLQNKREDDYKMYSVKDIQELMGCSRKKVYEIVNNYTFPKIVIGRQMFIPKIEYEKWVKKHLFQNITR